MKVLHVNDHPSGGGAEVVVDRLVRLQAARGHEVERFSAEDVPGLRRTPWGYVYSARARRALTATLERLRPDVVHLHNVYHLLSPSALAAASRYRDRHRAVVVMTAHDFHLLCPNPVLRFFGPEGGATADLERLGRLGDLLVRRWDHRGWGHSLLRVAQHLWSYRLLRLHHVPDTVIAPSRFLTALLEGRGIQATCVRHPWPNVEPPLRASPGGGRRPSHPLRLVFAGRVEPEKGLAWFLEHASLDAADELVVVGDGTELPRCREIARDRNLGGVRFLGALPRRETLAAISSGHLLVLPSPSPESAGLVLLEALAVGTNVLTTDHGGTGETARDLGVGYLFSPGDPGSLALALARAREAFRKGTLNAFSVPRTGRTEEEWVEAVEAVYRRAGAPA